MNTIGMIFLLPFIFLINSYFCGKIIKRFSREINDFLSITFGFFIYISGFQLLLLPIMIIHLNTYIYLYTFIIYQSILLILYILNWKYSLSPLFISWKQLLCTMIGILIIMGIIYGFMDYKNNDDVNVQDILNFNNENYIINGLISSLSNFFKVDNIQIIFDHWFNIVFAAIIAFGIFGMYFYDNELPWYRIISYYVILIIISVCSLVIYTSPSNGNSWILFSVILLIYNHIININNKNYKLGITNINFITLGLFVICPNSLYVIIMTNIYLLFMAFHYKFKNVFDYNIRGFFGCLLSICIFLKLNTDTFVIWIIIYSLIFLYILYYLIRNTKVMNPINNFFNNISMNAIKFITFVFAIIAFLVGMLTITIPGDFKFNSEPWIIKTFMNRQLIEGTALFWIVNICYYLVNVLLLIYAVLTYKNKKFQMYIENIRLSPMIAINTMTFWNPISTNFWYSISFSNVQAISNGFLNSFSTATINFIYYLVNKNKWSKSLTIFTIGSVLITTSLILINVLY